VVVLSRYVDDDVVIGGNVRVVVVAVEGRRVKLGIQAAREISVDRGEVFEEKQRAREAVAGESYQRGERRIPRLPR
jgi:carbon storage regulator